MSIRSDAFGRVQLTGTDATKFKNQVVHGKPKKAAKKTISDGVKLARALRANGKLRLKVALS